MDLSCPEMARFENRFEASMATATTSASAYHHEPERAFQATLLKDVKSLVKIIEEFKIPFKEESNDLIVLDTKVG